MECPTCNESPVCEAHPEDPVIDEPCEKEEAAPIGLQWKFPFSNHWAYSRSIGQHIHGVGKIHIILREEMVEEDEDMVVDIQLSRPGENDVVITAFVDNFNEESVSLSTHRAGDY